MPDSDMFYRYSDAIANSGAIETGNANARPLIAYGSPGFALDVICFQEEKSYSRECESSQFGNW